MVRGSEKKTTLYKCLSRFSYENNEVNINQNKVGKNNVTFPFTVK